MSGDSLNLLAYQSGLVATPLAEGAADATGDLCTEQRLLRIGDPLPIVFCRRQGSVGGCVVSPPATEARFANDASNVLTASWHLLLGEGPMDPIQARDVFQCACRVGTSTQAFGQRAGSWQPGNVTVDRGGTYTRWEVPRFCGSAGTFEGLSTLSFVNTHANGEEWNRQIHVFSRGGKYVTRLLDGVNGPSSNVVDLYLYLLRTVERVPEDLISIPSLKHAAQFTEALGMRWDGVLGGDETENLDDWCENILKPYFLLARTRVFGQEGLMPLLPTNNDGTLFLGPVGANATLTEADLDLETWNLEFLGLSDRRPICAQMMWRQQGDGIQSLTRTSEVRFAAPFNAPDGPFEQHDMSRFGTSETHAVKIGAYIVAHRALATHTLEVSARPGQHNRSVVDGSIVRVTVPLAIDGEAQATHDYLYRVSSIGKDLMGETKFSLMHLPLDDQGRSAISHAVYRAQPSGIVLPFNLTGPTCDVNSSTNETPLGEDLYDWDLPDDNPFDTEIPFDDLPLDDPLDIPFDKPFDEPPVDPPGPDPGPGPGPGPVPVPPPGPDPPVPPQPPYPPGPPSPGQPQIPEVPPGCNLYYESYTDDLGRKQERAVVVCPPEPPPKQPPAPGDPPTDPPGPPGPPGGGTWVIPPQLGGNKEIIIKYKFTTTHTAGRLCKRTFSPDNGGRWLEPGYVLFPASSSSTPIYTWRGEGHAISLIKETAVLDRVCSVSSMNTFPKPEYVFIGYAVFTTNASGQSVLTSYVRGAGWEGTSESRESIGSDWSQTRTYKIELVDITYNGRRPNGTTPQPGEPGW